MVSVYSGGELNQLQPHKCKRQACNIKHLTCHDHGPKEMEEFVLQRTMARVIERLEAEQEKLTASLAEVYKSRFDS